MNAPLLIFEKYEIIRRLASGGMGDIFLARQVGVAGFSRLVVLKSLRADIVERDDFFVQFLNEARTAATLNHPNVVAVYEIDEDRGMYFIAMEYIDGSDIGAVQRAAQSAKQKIPFRFSAGVIHDAALGLHHAHTVKDDQERINPIIHRDVSPQNVMVRLDGIAKVVDFGIAAAADRIDPFRGRLQGKLRYMSPEQLTGASLTGAADQFALGVVLWELMTQTRLFKGEDANEVLREISAGRIAAPSANAAHVPPALDAIVLRMLQRDPAQRFPSLKDVATALRAFLETTGGAADQQIAKFLGVMVGASVKERTRSLVPESVTISGLLDAADARCDACGHTSSLRHRYCPECGAPRGAAPVAPVAPKPRRTNDPVAPPSSASLRSLLRQHASALDDIFSGERKAAVVLAGKLTPIGERSREIDQRILRAITLAVEPFDPAVVQLTARQVLLVFHDVPDPMRALKLASEIASRTAGLATFSAVVAGGEIDVLGASSSASMRGPAIDRARERVDAIDGPGIHLERAFAGPLSTRIEVDPAGSELVFRRFREVADQRPPLLGRRDELVAGRELLAQAARGKSGTLLFAAGSGLGKTHLVESIAAVAAKQGFITIVSRSARGDVLVDTLRQALAAWVIGDPTLPARARLQPLGLAPGVAELVAASLEGAATAEAEVALIETLFQLSRSQAMCWVIDDLHLVEAQARAAIEKVHARIAGLGRMALVVSADQPTIVAGARIFALEPLADDKLLAVAQAHAGGLSLPLPVAQRVLLRSAGNPGVALAVIDALVALGGLVREADRWRVGPKWAELELPHHLDALIGAHIASLSKPAQTFMRVASVIESPFVPDLVFDIVRFGGDRPRTITELLDARLVRRARGEALEIAQGAVEAQLRKSVLDGDRRRVHARAAEVLMADDAPSAAVRAAIAHHLLSAGDDRRGAQEAARAAEAEPSHAIARSLWRRSIEAYRRAMVADPLLSDEALDAVALATPVIGAQSLEEAAKLVDGFTSTPTLSRAKALSARSKVLLQLGRVADAEDAARKALEMIPFGSDPALEALTVAARPGTIVGSPLTGSRLASFLAPAVEQLASVLEERGRLAEAAQEMSRAAALYESADDARALWRPLNALGRLYVRLGDKARAGDLLAAAHQAASAAQSSAGLTATAINRAALAPPEEALRLLDEAAEIAAEAGDALSRARIAYNKGSIALSLGRIADGQKALDEAVRVASQVGWNDGIALAHRALAAANLVSTVAGVSTIAGAKRS